METELESTQSSKWYYNDWFVIIMLLIFLPIGILLGVKSPNKFPWKKLLYGIGIVVVFMIIQLSKGNGSFYGRYDLETKSSGMKEMLDKYNAYIILNQDGSIVLHSEMTGYPVVHRTGRFDEGPDKKTMTFIGTRFNDGLPPYSITIKDGDLIIGSSTYSK